MKKIISFVLSIVIFTSIMPNCAFASEQEVLAQYSGSTTASYGFKPDNTLLENDGQSVNNNPKPNIEYGAGEDD